MAFVDKLHDRGLEGKKFLSTYAGIHLGEKEFYSLLLLGRK